QQAPLIDPEPVDLGNIADYAWEYVDTGAATFERDDLPVVSGDSGRLLRLFENLIRNAVEHGSTPEKPVTICIGSLTDGAGFFFEDDGCGIPPESRQKVFDHGYTTNRDGTGFGLPIVRDIATAHGWKVEIDESSSGGARFNFTRVQDHNSKETDV
ncbi:sensor histidine kinase, partial [Haloferax profundi]|uniref:sensor histidine kinase n=1 Tax=Haloferax profundi TaxID=1544718 RepID=UPI000AA4DCFE